MTDDDTTTAAPLTAAESILGNLKDRRQQIVDEQTLDLLIPRWHDPEILVRYRPVEHSVIRRAQNAVEKAPKDKKAEIEIGGNSDVLIRGCVAVVARYGGKEYSLRPGDPEGEPTLFDSDLAENIGLDDRATARDVVRKIFIADGDIMSHASALVEFSGYRETEADDKIKGE